MTLVVDGSTRQTRNRPLFFNQINQKGHLWALLLFAFVSPQEGNRARGLLCSVRWHCSEGQVMKLQPLSRSQRCLTHFLAQASGDPSGRIGAFLGDSNLLRVSCRCHQDAPCHTETSTSSPVGGRFPLKISQRVLESGSGTAQRTDYVMWNGKRMARFGRFRRFTLAPWRKGQIFGIAGYNVSLWEPPWSSKRTPNENIMFAVDSKKHPFVLVSYSLVFGWGVTTCNGATLGKSDLATEPGVRGSIFWCSARPSLAQEPE